MRAVWVVRDVLGSKERMLKLVDTAKRYEFTDLIVQVRGRGEAYYRSAIDPPAPRENGLADPLEFLFRELDGTGIKVHAWINTLLTWSGQEIPPGHIFDRHPEWSIVSEVGKSALNELITGTLDRRQVEGAYLCPSRPDVVDYLTAVYAEVARDYPVHGIHLDYIRMPSHRYCYCSVCRKGAAESPSHHTYLRRQVTRLTRHIRDACKNARPDVVYSAAVFPAPDDARENKAQDWVAWTHDGTVDMLFPMAYHADPGQTVAYVQKVKSLSGVPVVAGLGAYLQSPRDMSDTLQRLNLLELAGVCYFSYNTFEKNPEYLPTIVPTKSQS